MDAEGPAEEAKARGPLLTRRRLLGAAAAGGGLLVGWALWPEDEVAQLPAAENESTFGLWLKIATSGQVTVNVPQSEMGQGVMTQLAAVAARELGADWRTMAIQPVAPDAGFANMLLAEEWSAARLDSGGLFGGGDTDWARELPFVVTAGSSSLRMFGPLVRDAAGAARVMLTKAAAQIWDVDWTDLDTRDGFVVDSVTDGDGKYGDVKEGRRLPFADLADAASRESMPDPVPLREWSAEDSEGEDRVRLDMPSKLDGSANFAADIRLTGMVYASVRSAPIGATLDGIDTDALKDLSGIVGTHLDERWFAVAAIDWWTANRALDAARPAWKTGVDIPTDAGIEEALVEAIGGTGTRIEMRGDVEAALTEQTNRVFVETARFRAAVHAPAETRSAAVRIAGGTAELWVASQAPADARARVARALDRPERSVTIYPMLGGGSFGRNLDNEVAVMAAKIAQTLGRPVSLMLSREEDMRLHHFRPPAIGHVSGAVDAQGRLQALSLKLALPSFMVETMARIAGTEPRGDAVAQAAGTPDRLAVEGAVPPYAIPSLEVAHFPVDLGIRTGVFRGNSHNIGVFLVENFIDQLASRTGAEPLSYRVGMLGENPRLARCLTRVGEMADWDGGVRGDDGGAMGIACASLRGSHVAVVAEVQPGETGPRVTRLSACVDAGRLIDVDIARQQVEGALIFGLGQAFGNAVHFDKGRVVERRLIDLGLPRFEDSPEIQVEFVSSGEEPGGIGEIGVPTVAPAIAAALERFDNKRRWALPFA